jgi:hypothetical protein
VIRDSLREASESCHEGVDIQPKLLGQAYPVPAGNPVQSVLPPDAHRELENLSVEMLVWERRRHVVQRGEADLPDAQQDRVVLRMRVGSADEPVEGERFDERLDGAWGGGEINAP